ncbi:MAG: trehalose-phosphatase [Acidimicrobiia bacterium]|nr:trehalose-phosphatase [Acidimicrobiia bacterium]
MAPPRRAAFGGVPAPLRPLASRPAQAGVYTDFDGTLAPIVDDPDEARPLPGVAATLAALADRYARVGVISGRPVHFLLANIKGSAPGRSAPGRSAPGTPKDVDLWGEYGLERVVGGEVQGAGGAAQWRDAVHAVAGRADAAGVAERVERKSLSVTLHWRADPARQAAVRAWAEQQAARTGLEVLAARQAVELRPPLHRDKGTALAAAAAGLGAACFLGDDRGDLAAFDALDRLAADGVDVARVAVRSHEMPEELERRADLVVDGPEGALALLQALLGEP